MNSKLKLHILSRSTEQGFAMFAALGIGLVMFLVGITMVVRSQGDQVTASTQKSTARSLSATEIGLTRVQALLKLIPKLGRTDLPNWEATYDAALSSATCSTSTNIASDDLLQGNWVKVDDTDLSKGQFKILSYQYDSSKSIGTLTLAGKDGDFNNTANTNKFKSTSSVQVKIPLVDLMGVPVPALWAQNFSMGNQKVSGNVVVQGCSIPSGLPAGNVLPFPDGSASQIMTNISVPFPDLPALPPVCPSSGTMLPSCYQLFKNSQTTNITNGIPEAITTTTALPRTWDIAGADGVYRYLIGKNSSGNSIDLSGNSSITVVTNNTTTPKQKVVLYVQGNVDMGGTTALIHNGFNSSAVLPSNFLMFGSDGLGNYKSTIDSTLASNYKTTSLVLAGSNTSAMLIYAPEAAAGVNGGGNITGTVWVKSWGLVGSNSSKTVVTQNMLWSDLTDFAPPKTIAAIQSWQRQEAP